MCSTIRICNLYYLINMMSTILTCLFSAVVCDSRFVRWGCLMLCGMLLTVSCTERTDLSVPMQEDGVLYLTLPVTGEALHNTRAASFPVSSYAGEEEATADESRITSLWFLAYPVEEGKGEIVVTQLNPDGLAEAGKTYQIRMKYGTYRIYVVANIPGIDLSYANADGEERLKNCRISYPFAADNGLPMSYRSTEPVTVDENGGSLNAELEFACVKVRCTVLFDNTAFFKAAFGSHVVKMNTSAEGGAVWACNYACETGLWSGLVINPETGNATSGYRGYYQEGTDFNKEDILPSVAGKWAFRTDFFYLPEHMVTVDKQEQQTSLVVKGKVYSAEGTFLSNLVYTINMGDVLGQETSETGQVRQLPRGRYYDITAHITGLGEQLDLTASVTDWTPHKISSWLEGPYTLYIQKNELGELRAGDEITVPCHTNAATLTYESPTCEVNGQEVPVYQVDFEHDPATEAITAFTVRIAPQMPPVLNDGTSLPDYFYIVAGNLKKKITVTPQLQPYLYVTPEQQTVYIKEVGTRTAHKVTYTYFTNLTNIEITLTEGQNEKITYQDSGLNNGQGTLTCILSNSGGLQAGFPNSLTQTYRVTATGYEQTLTEDVKLNIVPNAMYYRLYFRPKNVTWDNPHIYVYEPLFTPNGTEVRFQVGSSYFENALLYSFTGMRTFKGWNTQGGEVANPVPSGYDNGGTYNGLNDSFKPENAGQQAYYIHIDYCPDFRQGSDCPECSKSWVNVKWPGVRMKNAEAVGHLGWFYFDLPLLAQPGKALIMFADGHSGPSDNSKYYRYPAHMVPGVPLYNFADKEGWFLYDVDKGDANEFVDDKPEGY